MSIVVRYARVKKMETMTSLFCSQSRTERRKFTTKQTAPHKSYVNTIVTTDNC